MTQTLMLVLMPNELGRERVKTFESDQACVKMCETGSKIESDCHANQCVLNFPGSPLGKDHVHRRPFA
jgi:hypothetical protein